ncbi:MAG: primase C-terminal domain-containing protein [Sandaracinaceae bacterium]|nr:primase C-terminal domain-containing protein [Sandaracinaceae bacterium]
MIFSTFDGLRDNIPKQIDCTWAELVEACAKHERVANKHDCGLYAPAVFAPGTARRNSNVLHVAFLSLDFDRGDTRSELSKIRNREVALAWFYYSTHSHSEDGHRYRAVVQLSRPVNANEWKLFWPAALAELRISPDPACSDCARMYFVPACPLEPELEPEFESFEGIALDVDAVLRRSTAQQSSNTRSLSRANTALAVQRPQKAEPSVRVQEGGRNHALFLFACQLRQKGLNADEMLPTLMLRNSEFIPPLDEDEVLQVAQSCERYDVGKPLTDLGNAHRLVALAEDNVLHIEEIGWTFYDGTRWVVDRDRSVERLCHQVSNVILAETATLENEDVNGDLENLVDKFKGWHKSSQSNARLKAMLEIARGLVSRSVEDFDRQPSLLNVLNGTIDLISGELHPHERSDWLMKQAPVAYDADATCPAFEAFLAEILPDAETRAFVQRLFGYATTGLTTEHILPIFWGGGANGKTTLIEVVMNILGDYARPGPRELLLAQQFGDKHPTEIASLFGARLVVISETGAGRKLDEQKMKQLTGGDRIAARFMRKDFFYFDPTHKILMLTNNKPEVLSTDEGTWRRVALVRFPVVIPKERRDKRLKEKLLAEAPGILAWLIRGARKWHEQGLGRPAAIQADTNAYRTGSDRIATFLDERCVQEPVARSASSRLHRAYQDWARANGDYSGLSITAFAEAMSNAGIQKKKSGQIWYLGIRVVGDGADGTPDGNPFEKIKWG